MNIFQQQFTTGQVAAAAGVTNATLQSWLRQDRIIGHRSTAEATPIQGGGGPGAYRRYSFFNVMEIAVAKALLDAGLGNVADAFAAASGFAHVGCGPLKGLRPERVPSLPYDDREGGSLTLLCVRGAQSTVTRWIPTEDFYPNVRHRLGEGFLLLEIDPLFDRVVDVLGHDRRDVMANAYPRPARKE